VTQLTTREALGAARPEQPSTNRIGIVVGHTHWDREWYLPFEGFRTRLVAMLDALVEILEKDPEFRSFMLDGQAIMVEDYLQVRPEMEERVKRLAKAGRLKVGPWYTATDTLLPDPESLVRNLQLGRWVSQRLGAEPMPVGYMPDLFGFSAQIPQILKNFGIDNAFAWRGLHPENGANLCWWASPDGTQALTLRLQEGYSEAVVGAVDPERFLSENLSGLVEKQDKGLYRNRLFMMGSDHFIANARLPWLSARIAEQVQHPVQVGSLDEMVDLLRSELSAQNHLPVISGEQRDSCLVVCPASVAGTRIPLKQANQRVEAALLGVAEPLQALAELVGGGSDRSHLRWAWRLLTQNHAHDSIPGCGIDEVHREMMTRFASAEMVARDAAQRGARRLARALSPQTRGELGALGVVSLVGGKNRLRARLHGPAEGVPSFRLVQPDGQEIPFSVTGRGSGYVQYHRLQDAFATHDATAYVHLVAPQEWLDNQRSRPRMLHLPWVEIEFELDAPKAGYRVLRLEKAGRWPSKPKAASNPQNELSNSLMRVWAEEAGLFIQHKASGRTVGPINFSHRGERGDEYTACLVPGAAVTFAPQAGRAKITRPGLVEQLVLPIQVQVPAGLGPDRLTRTGQVRLSGQMIVRLLGERVDISLTLENRARNYDLRLVTRVEGAQTGLSGAPFTVEQRPFESDHIQENPAQSNLPDFPLRGWVALQAADGAGWAVVARGLYEASVTRVDNGGEIALTLLRGVDFLSRHDLNTRPDHAGPMIPTPDAQCIGRHEWELALLPFGPAEAAAIPARVEEFLRPAATFPVQWSAGSAPAEQSLFEGDGLVVISTLKPGFEEDGVILHAHNPTGEPRRVQIAGPRVNLDETPGKGDNLIRPFEVAAWQVKAR
jgi:mannosylglycerate hydrolase